MGGYEHSAVIFSNFVRDRESVLIAGVNFFSELSEQQRVILRIT